MLKVWLFSKCGMVTDKPVHTCGSQCGGKDGYGCTERNGVGEVEARQGDGQREARRLDKPGQRKSQQDGCDLHTYAVCRWQVGTVLLHGKDCT